MYTGQCLCGDITFEYEGPLGPLSLCHCSQCRRAHGSAFSARDRRNTYTRVQSRTGLKLLTHCPNTKRPNVPAILIEPARPDTLSPAVNLLITTVCHPALFERRAFVLSAK